VVLIIKNWKSGKIFHFYNKWVYFWFLIIGSGVDYICFYNSQWKCWRKKKIKIIKNLKKFFFLKIYKNNRKYKDFDWLFKKKNFLKFFDFFSPSFSLRIKNIFIINTTIYYRVSKINSIIIEIKNLSTFLKKLNQHHYLIWGIQNKHFYNRNKNFIHFFF